MKTLAVSSRHSKLVPQKSIKPRIFNKIRIRGWLGEDCLSSIQLRKVEELVKRFSQSHQGFFRQNNFGGILVIQNKVLHF